MNQAMVKLELNLPLERARAVLSFLNVNPGEPGITSYSVTKTHPAFVMDEATSKNRPIPKLDVKQFLNKENPDPNRSPGRRSILNAKGEQAVWHFHCEGYNCREISEALQKVLCPEAVRLVVKRIEKHMPKKGAKRS